MNKSADRHRSRGGEAKAGSHPQQLAGVLTLVKDLAAVIHSDSTAELFGQSFHTLASAVPFDVGVAVMLEQNLDVYISARPAASKLIGQPLIDRVRGVLKNVIPVSFTGAEIIVKDERQTLDGNDARPAGLQHDDPGAAASATAAAAYFSRTVSRTEATAASAASLAVAAPAGPFRSDAHAVQELINRPTPIPTINRPTSNTSGCWETSIAKVPAMVVVEPASATG